MGVVGSDMFGVVAAVISGSTIVLVLARCVRADCRGGGKPSMPLWR
jgi:hypothetical protein